MAGTERFWRGGGQMTKILKTKIKGAGFASIERSAFSFGFASFPIKFSSFVQSIKNMREEQKCSNTTSVGYL